jgi:hypothetical protein
LIGFLDLFFDMLRRASTAEEEQYEADKEESSYSAKGPTYDLIALV